MYHVLACISEYFSVCELANITWTNCENIEISGLVFILSGQFHFLPEYADDLLSAELVFQAYVS